TKCSERESLELRQYFGNLETFLGNHSCAEYTKHSPNCLLPVLQNIEITDRQPLPDPLAIDCLMNINPDARYTCSKVAQINWNITKIHNATTMQLCCATWQDIDCLDEISGIRCINSELAASERYFKLIEDWLEDNACEDYPYHSYECSQSRPHRKPKITTFPLIVAQ
ncbi:unnamed protein product, partial [Oppiella nova]